MNTVIYFLAALHLICVAAIPQIMSIDHLNPKELNPGQENTCNVEELKKYYNETEGKKTNYHDGNGQFSYHMKYNEPVSKHNWTNLYYPIIISKCAHRSRMHYYAWYTPVGYTGFQPRGLDKIQIIFSAFSRGATVIDSKHCRAGADGAKSGVSCALRYSPFKYGELYFIRIRRIANLSFEAHLLDSHQVLAKVGAYTLARPHWKAERFYTGFIENYIDERKTTCCGIYRASALIFAPISTDGMGGFGRNMKGSKYNTECTDKAGNDISEVHSFKVQFEGNLTVTTEAVSFTRGWANPITKKVESGKIKIYPCEY